jgi:hypothetical protein
MAKKRKTKSTLAVGKKETNPQKNYPRTTARVTKDEGYNPNLVQRYVHDMNIVASKIPFQIFDIVDNLVLMDPYVNKYHHTTVALGNSGHELTVFAESLNQAQKAIDEANRLADRCFPLSGGMSGLISGCFSQLARTAATCVEWVPVKSFSFIDQGFLVPIKTIRFTYGENGTYVLNQQQSGGIVPLNPAQTIYYNAMVKDGNPYATPPIVAAIEPCANHKAIVDKIAQWMDKVSALGVMLAEVEPPPRIPGETQEQYDSKAGTYLNNLAKSISTNMSSGLGVAYNNVKFQFQNTQAGASGAKELLQLVLQGVFAGLQRDPIMFGWNFGNSDAFVKVVYEELMQSLAFYQRGVKKIIEHGHRLNLALCGLGDCKISVQFKAARSLDQFRDSEAEYMDSKKILDQLSALTITTEEARKQLGYDQIPTINNTFTATFSRDDNKYQLLCKEPHFFSVNNNFLTNHQTTYKSDITSILGKAHENGIAAMGMWMSLQGNFSLDDVVTKGLGIYLDYAEKAISEKDIATLSDIEVRSSWEDGQNNPLLFSKVNEDRQRGMTAEEAALIYFLSQIVEPYMVKHFLSRSEWRVGRARNTISELYHKYDLDNPTTEKINNFKAAVSEYLRTMGQDAAKAMSDVTTTRSKTWGALHALKQSSVERFMIMGPDDDRKCEFCRSMLYKVFSVDKEIDNIKSMADSGNPELGDMAEFITKKYSGKKGLSALNDMTPEELQGEGLVTPPYHGNCRDYVVGI